jgi:hypothetical protein
MPTAPYNGSAEDVRQRLGFPLPSRRCGYATPVESGGDLAKRLGSCSLGVSKPA